ncbi:hypothetical protein K1T73_04085 [Roseovarius sp. SCSIO 43702]|nr:hypothetical protein [Roseovarius sp. SCSIO 43702]QYX57584.1 hypothetical protein K1T73_04085 [Roseovarius sp. SCSIO 43702]
MKKLFAADRAMLLTGLTLLGMLLAVLALWPLRDSAAQGASVVGLLLVYA